MIYGEVHYEAYPYESWSAGQRTTTDPAEVTCPCCKRWMERNL